jgi:ribosome-binding ATPase YchF (GTP1/OBG family)
MDELTNEAKIIIINEEIRQWVGESYRRQLRHRVQTKLGNTAMVDAIEKEMELIEQSLDELRAALLELNGDSG